jgi:penicillin-binding protein 2
MEKKLKGKYRFFQLLTVVLFAILVVRLGTLQLLEASVYKTKAEQNQFRLLPIRAPRGDIIDHEGKVLASNKTVNTISIVRQQADTETLNKTIDNLAALLADHYPEIDAAYIKELMDDHSVRPYEPIVIKRDVPIEVIARLEERRRELPGVVIRSEMVRYYPENTLASHLLGHIGEISEDELKNDTENKYQQGDLIGRFGLELQYDDYLRGKDGFQQVEVDINERPVSNENMIQVDPEQGNNLVLTLDYELQKALEEGMDASLEKLKKSAGAAVVIDVNTGGILAMVSRPGFDPNSLVPPVSSKIVQEYLNPGPNQKPVMINRAISSKYPPGSTFKPVTAIAALETGKMTPSSTVRCSGGWHEPNLHISCGVHGTVNLARAMAVSCNVYFIEAGRRVGVDDLYKYIEQVGLVEKTGIDLPGEVAGDASNPEKKKAANLPWLDEWYEDEKNKLEEKYGNMLKEAESEQEKQDILFRKKDAERVLKNEYQIKYNYDVAWRPYETYFMAFGQGGTFTPIGLANYAAAVANGGKVMKPHLVQRIESPEGEVISQVEPTVLNEVDASAETMAQVREAMKKVTDPGGTAYSLFKDLSVKVAAKTGTAEYKTKQYHGVFIAFAPADNPEIAFAGIIEDGYHGSTSAGPVCRDVFKVYFGEED